MIVHVRCPRCGYRMKEHQGVLGQTIPCPGCRAWMRVEPGMGVSGEATIARAVPAEPPAAQPASPHKASEQRDEPSAWRHPAVWIGVLTILALIAIYVVTMRSGKPPSHSGTGQAKAPEPTATAPSPSPTGSAPSPPLAPQDAGAAPTVAPAAPAGGDPNAQTPPLPTESATPADAVSAGADGSAGSTASPAAEALPTPAPPEAPSPPAPSQPASLGAAGTASAPWMQPAQDADANAPLESPAASQTALAEPLSAEALFKQASPAVARVVVRDRLAREQGLGSGFFVSADGRMVTNHHVVDSAYSAYVVLSSGLNLPVQGVLALDADADLAVLKVDGRGLPHLTLAARGHTPPVGSRVYAIGNPQGFTNTLSEGLVSGRRAVTPGLSLLQTTAPISAGSSGGPLLDATGRVIGVTTFSLVSRDSQNLNFAVPTDKVWSLLSRAARARPTPLNRVPNLP